MSLNQDILSSTKQPIAYIISPYKPQNQVVSFGNRFMSNVTQPVPVHDIILTTSTPGQVPRNVQATYNRPSPFTFDNGAAAVAGNNTPGRKGV